MIFTNIEAAEKVITGLLNDADNISALNSGAYLTTRITNIISDLRNADLEIENEFHKTINGKRFCIYRLADSEANFKKAHELLEYVQRKLSGREAPTI